MQYKNTTNGNGGEEKQWDHYPEGSFVNCKIVCRQGVNAEYRHKETKLPGNLNGKKTKYFNR